MEVFNLSNNQFGEEGSINIFNALSQNKKLTKLLIKKNGVTNISGHALLKAIKYNKVISNINLNENSLELSEIAAIEVLLERNR